MNLLTHDEVAFEVPFEKLRVNAAAVYATEVALKARAKVKARMMNFIVLLLFVNLLLYP